MAVKLNQTLTFLDQILEHQTLQQNNFFTSKFKNNSKGLVSYLLQTLT